MIFSVLFQGTKRLPIAPIKCTINPNFIFFRYIHVFKMCCIWSNVNRHFPTNLNQDLANGQIMWRSLVWTVLVIFIGIRHRYLFYCKRLADSSSQYSKGNSNSSVTSKPCEQTVITVDGRILVWHKPHSKFSYIIYCIGFFLNCQNHWKSNSEQSGKDPWFCNILTDGIWDCEKLLYLELLLNVTLSGAEIRQKHIPNPLNLNSFI